MLTNLLVGAAIHSFIDDMALATAYSTGTRLGVITTVAVLFHEAPHHIGDVSILIHKGVPVMQAVGLSLLAGGTAAVGALLVLLAGTESIGVTTLLLPFTTANFLSMPPQPHAQNCNTNGACVSPWPRRRSSWRDVR